jgi:uncharacterized protein involved in tellurium resistance
MEKSFLRVLKLEGQFGSINKCTGSNFGRIYTNLNWNAHNTSSCPVLPNFYDYFCLI